MVEMKNFPRNNTNVEFTPQFPKVKGNREKENQSPYLTDKENPPKIKIDKQKEIPQMIERYRSPSPVLINKNRKLFIKNNAENTNTHNLSKGRSTPKSQYTFKTPYKLESAGKKATVQHWQY